MKNMEQLVLFITSKVVAYDIIFFIDIHNKSMLVVVQVSLSSCYKLINSSSVFNLSITLI